MKTYKDSYLYNNKLRKANSPSATNIQSALKEYIMTAHRIDDKESDAFRGIVEDIKRQQTSSILYYVLMMDRVKICIGKSELPRAFKVFDAYDIKNGSKPAVFVDASGIIEYKNGYYYCKKIDVLITYLLDALVYILYRDYQNKLNSNVTIVTSGAECYVSLFNSILDYSNIIGYSANKNKIAYFVALFYLTNIIEKPLDNYTKNIAAKIAGIGSNEIRAFELYLNDDSFENISTFVDFLSSTFNLKGFNLEVLVSKWIYQYGQGTQYAIELFSSFAILLANSYVGAYIVNQKQIERNCGLVYVKFITEIMKCGSATFSKIGYMEQALEKKSRNSIELSRSMKLRESVAPVLEYNDFISSTLVKDKIDMIKEYYTNTRQESKLSKVAEASINEGLKAVDLFAKNEQDYEFRTIIETAKAFKGNYDAKSIDRITKSIDAEIENLQGIAQKLVDAPKEDKVNINKMISELRETFQYIK